MIRVPAWQHPRMYLEAIKKGQPCPPDVLICVGWSE